MITTTFHNCSKPEFFEEFNPWINRVINTLFPNVDAIDYVFCNDEYLLHINREQLDHDYYTDIITFDLRDTLNDPLSCEIYISLDRVRENAEQFNCTFAEELKRVMAHGLLHLSGYNDSTEKEKAEMREAENKLMHLH